MIAKAMTMAILGSQSRNLPVDRLCLLIIFALSNVLYLKNRWIVSLSIVFAVVALLLNLTPIESGWISDVLRNCAESRFPAPRVFDMRDFVDYNDGKMYDQKIGKELVIYNYCLVNIIVFLSFWIAQAFLAYKRTSKEDA